MSKKTSIKNNVQVAVNDEELLLEAKEKAKKYKHLGETSVVYIPVALVKCPMTGKNTIIDC